MLFKLGTNSVIDTTNGVIYTKTASDLMIQPADGSISPTQVSDPSNACYTAMHTAAT